MTVLPAPVVVIEALPPAAHAEPAPAVAELLLIEPEAVLRLAVPPAIPATPSAPVAVLPVIESLFCLAVMVAPPPAPPLTPAWPDPPSPPLAVPCATLFRPAPELCPAPMMA
ncbi:hypothetical protein MYFR107205_30790 [Mycolicibacterium frederiksbergense]